MSESIGATLRAARGKRRLTLEQVSEATRIRVQYLQALENDDLSAMTSAAQARGFMRLYAEFLGLDPAALMPSTAPAAAADADAGAPTAPQKKGADTEAGVPPQPEATPATPGFLAGLRGLLSRVLPAKSASTSPESEVAAESATKKKALR